MARKRLLLGFALAAPLLACSSEDDQGGGELHHPEKTGGSGGTNVIIDPNARGGSSSSGGNGATGPDDCGTSVLNGCVGEFYEGESLPLDIYIMFDQSGSMLNDVGGMTRLQAIQRAGEQFLRDPAPEFMI